MLEVASEKLTEREIDAIVTGFLFGATRRGHGSPIACRGDPPFAPLSDANTVEVEEGAAARDRERTKALFPKDWGPFHSSPQRMFCDESVGHEKYLLSLLALRQWNREIQRFAAWGQPDTTKPWNYPDLPPKAQRNDGRNHQELWGSRQYAPCLLFYLNDQYRPT
jgi:hypothetical protein